MAELGGCAAQQLDKLHAGQVATIMWSCALSQGLGLDVATRMCVRLSQPGMHLHGRAASGSGLRQGRKYEEQRQATAAWFLVEGDGPPGHDELLTDLAVGPVPAVRALNALSQLGLRSGPAEELCSKLVKVLPKAAAAGRISASAACSLLVSCSRLGLVKRRLLKELLEVMASKVVPTYSASNSVSNSGGDPHVASSPAADTSALQPASTFAAGGYTGGDVGSNPLFLSVHQLRRLLCAVAHLRDGLASLEASEQKSSLHRQAQQRRTELPTNTSAAATATEVGQALLTAFVSYVQQAGRVTGADVAIAAWSAARLQVTDLATWAQLQGLLLSVVSEAPSRLVAGARASAEATAVQGNERQHVSAQLQHEHLLPRQFADLCWAFGSSPLCSDQPPRQEGSRQDVCLQTDARQLQLSSAQREARVVGDALADCALPLLQRCQPHELVEVLWGIARLGPSPDLHKQVINAVCVALLHSSSARGSLDASARRPPLVLDQITPRLLPALLWSVHEACDLPDVRQLYDAVALRLQAYLPAGTGAVAQADGTTRQAAGKPQRSMAPDASGRTRPRLWQRQKDEMSMGLGDKGGVADVHQASGVHWQPVSPVASTAGDLGQAGAGTGTDGRAAAPVQQQQRQRRQQQHAGDGRLGAYSPGDVAVMAWCFAVAQGRESVGARPASSGYLPELAATAGQPAASLLPSLLTACAQSVAAGPGDVEQLDTMRQLVERVQSSSAIQQGAVQDAVNRLQAAIPHAVSPDVDAPAWTFPTCHSGRWDVHAAGHALPTTTEEWQAGNVHHHMLLATPTTLHRFALSVASLQRAGAPAIRLPVQEDMVARQLQRLSS